MSLGGDPTDGLDPMSLAVDELSRQSGTQRKLYEC
jgi:hypothetical protein